MTSGRLKRSIPVVLVISSGCFGISIHNVTHNMAFCSRKDNFVGVLVTKLSSCLPHWLSYTEELCGYVHVKMWFLIRTVFSLMWTTGKRCHYLSHTCVFDFQSLLLNSDYSQNREALCSFPWLRPPYLCMQSQDLPLRERGRWWWVMVEVQDVQPTMLTLACWMQLCNVMLCFGSAFCHLI